MIISTVGGTQDSDTDDRCLDDVSELTASVHSSIYAYKYEHGRRYHAYKEGKYFMPNDELEQDRMLAQHRAGFLALGERNYLCPLPPTPQHILDLGCGVGVWAEDMAQEFPDTEITGVDLSPIQQKWVLENVKFEVDDIEEPWTFEENHFDLIFSRYMLAGSVGSFQRYFEQAYKHCRPGGYFEIQELRAEICSERGPIPEDNIIKQWCRLMRQGIQVMDRRLDLDFDEITRMVRSAGFENVVVVPYKQPIGSWPLDRTLKEAGITQFVAMMEGLESLSLKVFCRCLEWRKEDLDEFLKRVRTEFTNRKAWYYWPGVVIYGRKPVPVPVPTTPDDA